MTAPLLATFFTGNGSRPFDRLPAERCGKVYVDLPHRFFADTASMFEYLRSVRDIGANVMLLLPHFLPSFSEYVVKDYERPCPLFGSWETFGAFMAAVRDLGMDRMIDIPFNHADRQAEHLQPHWYQAHEAGGIEAGADDVDADGNRVRINWGAYVLDNGSPELIRYWLDKVIRPHVRHLNVNAIRIDAAWGLDRDGLAEIVHGTKALAPDVWFVAENLGMARLIELAESGLAAGAERYFNNMYWYDGGRYIPSDIYRFHKRSKGRPSCAIWSSHDVLMPAMKVLPAADPARYGGFTNDKALHRQVVEYDGIRSLAQFTATVRDRVLRLMKLDLLLACFQSSDLMFTAGSERGLIERIDVLRTGPAEWSRGAESDIPAFFKQLLRVRGGDELFNRDGVLIPFGTWKRGTTGIRGYVKRVPGRDLLVAANMDLDTPRPLAVPACLRSAQGVREISGDHFRQGDGRSLAAEVMLAPGQGCIMYSI
ncbi:MAG TPA: hypothetical protein VIV61_02655 [Candidatus Ozemobacteraceae bacterium]